jgi:inner membrane protein
LDSLTHIVLGGCIGEAVAGRKIGRKSLWIGAIANSLPDIDFITSSWLEADDNLLAHRGLTHSFFFAAIATWVCALLCNRIYKKLVPLHTWLLLFSVEIIAHLFIDAFNVYGTGWFEPFSHQRISFNTLFVADPLFSIWPGIAFLMLLIKRKKFRPRFWTTFGIGLSGLYLVYAVINKLKTEHDIKAIMDQQHIPHTNYFTTPTPLNNWLWYVVTESGDHFKLGYYSVLNRKQQITFYDFPKNKQLLDTLINKKDVRNLIQFSKGFYTVEKRNDTLVFNDLRFGQITGWHDPTEKFVFQFYLKKGADNRLVIQRGRFAKWSKASMLALMRSIKGE